MARLFADGFDHYGTDENNMLDGAWAEVGADTRLSTSPTPATGTHCIGVFDGCNPSSFAGLRKVLPAAKDKMGICFRLYLPSLSDNHHVVQFLSASSTRAQINCRVDENGRFLFYRGHSNNYNEQDQGTLLVQTDPVITAAAWNHVEIQVYIHDTLGWIRMAINGVHRLEALNLDTKYDSTNIVSIGHTHFFGASDIPFYMDDYILYDFTGTPATDTDFCPTYDGAGIATGYIDELQVMWLPPNGNTAEDDWFKSTGSSAFALVDEVDPNDADYIYSTTVGDLTELALSDLPAEITYIRGVDFWGRMSKADAGAAQVKFGSKSVAATTDATQRPVTVEPTYWWDQINLDPNTTARWTRAGLNASWFRLTRSV